MIEVHPSDHNYPRFYTENQRRPTFYLNREYRFNLQPFLAIVGAREARQWVLEWMENELPKVLTRGEWVVLSGGARGVDQKAHSLALRSDRPTVVMLPCEIGRIYPKSLSDLAVHSRAVLMSEHSEPQEMRFSNFYTRNSWIVAMSTAVFVVQAAEKSGSMMTARIAFEAGIPLATLPANPMDSSMSGNNQLIYEGASLVRSAEDLDAFLNGAISSSFF